MSLNGEVTVKNHTDVLIFHRRFCAGATKSESQMKNRICGFFIACLRKERSGMEVFMKKNKIVLISKEVLGTFYLPVYGGGGYSRHTPNIDELATKGTVFRHHYTAAPSTAMSFLSMITGLYSYQTGIRTYEPLKQVFKDTLFRAFYEMGYNSHVIWDGQWDKEWTNYTNIWQHTSFHYVDNMGVRLGPKFPHKRPIARDEEASRQVLERVEQVLAEAMNAQDKTFTWIHFPYALAGRTGYGTDLDLFDACVGIVRKYTSDDSIYITADHGNMNGRKGKVGYGFDVYEPAIHIPLITPRIDGIENYEDITSNIDLREIILNNVIPRHETVLSDTAYYAQKHRKLAVIGRRYKYIFNKETATEELYDLLYDAHEDMNLVSMDFYDVDRKIYEPLEEVYDYPFWEESRAVLEAYRAKKNEIWQESTLQEKIYYKLKHIFKI